MTKKNITPNPESVMDGFVVRNRELFTYQTDKTRVEITESGAQDQTVQIEHGEVMVKLTVTFPKAALKHMADQLNRKIQETIVSVMSRGVAESEERIIAPKESK